MHKTNWLADPPAAGRAVDHALDVHADPVDTYGFAGSPAGSFGWWAKVLFMLGMFVLAFMVATLPGELEARERTVEAIQKRLDALEAQAERLVLADKPKTRRKQPKR